MRKSIKGGETPKGSSIRLRIYVVLGFFLVFFCAIFARAFQLQVLEAKSLMRMAARQHKKTTNIPPKRGDIYDRNMKELAVSIEVDSVFAQPAAVESPKVAARMLAPLLSMDRLEIEKKLNSKSGFVWLKRQIDLDDGRRKAVAAIDGVGIMKESRRYYPNRQLASHIVGFTGVDANGLEGVELHYDGMLKGAGVKFVSDKDAMGRPLIFEDMEKTVQVKGMAAELTIDKTIQYVTERELKKAVDSTGARGGSAVVMNPITGEVLAMASYPSYDPNDASASSLQHRRNKGVTDAFEPGSVFKLFVISSALEENATKLSDVYFCENGVFKVADRTFHDAESHGWLTVPQIIKVSSNIGAAKVGRKLGRERLYRYLKAYGFGGKTGIDLPGESTGMLRNYKTWSNVTLETVSFGQGVSTTPIQLITALSAIANGGFIMKPYVVKSVRDPNGVVVQDSAPTIVRRVISEATAKKMTEMLIGVTQPGGTGTRAAMPDFEVAGKTGTAQKPDFKSGGYVKGAFTSSFFGFLPARAPKIAILVSLDEPKGEYHGGTVAAPVFKAIASESLPLLGVYPDGKNAMTVQFVKADTKKTAEAEPVADNVIDAVSRPMSVPDFKGKSMRAVMRLAQSRSFDVDVVGSGVAVSQKPGPGQSVPPSAPVTVWFQ